MTRTCNIGIGVVLGLACLAVALSGEAAGKTKKPSPAKATVAKGSIKTAAAAKHVPLPKPRPAAAGPSRAPGPVLASISQAAIGSFTRVTRSAPEAAFAEAPAFPTGEIATVKQAITAARKGDAARAFELQRTLADPAARKLIEWVVLRGDDNEADFSHYANFVAANPNWPSVGALRRRAEAMLWQENMDPAAIRAFFAKHQPSTAKGRFALARLMIAQGDRARAQALVREAWYYENFSPELEQKVPEVFPGFITAADYKARMDMRLYAEDTANALRLASHAGGNAPAIAKARIAVIRKAGNAKALLDALPTARQQRDIGVIFSRIQWLRRADKGAEAGALMLSVPRDSSQPIDTDQWWIERRLVARKLLDLGDYKSAYLVARDAATPSKENYRIEHEFTAGWIALRFLNNPTLAQDHFRRMAEGVRNPISLARAGYWQGRAAEAMGRTSEARAHYQAAARYPTAYYGQIARARLGHKDIPLHALPERPDAAQLEIVRAMQLLYAAGENDLAVIAAAGLGDGSNDPVALAAVGKVAAHHRDARAMVLLGKLALGRGLPLDHYAFPTVGIPDYKAIGPHVDRSVIYAIARQESIFNQKTVSSAKAMGLMQVTPAAGRETAKKFGAKYDGRKLLSDPVYNVQMGAAELGDLLDGYRGSYILTFAGYNAGRGSVRKWIEQYGDPRDPNVDPIDWVERIPFSETRNYVQRVMENMQVYRVRFGGGNKLLIEADLHRGAAN